MQDGPQVFAESGTATILYVFSLCRALSAAAAKLFEALIKKTLENSNNPPAWLTTATGGVRCRFGVLQKYVATSCKAVGVQYVEISF